MPKETHLEFKVGAFVLAALIALVVFIFQISDTSVLKQGKPLKVVFGFANGLKKSAPVRIAGVDEGLVKDIRLFFDPEDSKTKVAVEIWVKEGTKIPVDSEVIVNQLGMMGEKYIDIFPGRDTAQFFKEGQVIRGTDPIAQAEISERMMEVADRVENAIGGIDRLVSNEHNLESVALTLENLSFLTANLDAILYDISEGGGTVGKLLYDDRLYENLEGLTADLKANPWKLLYRPKEKRSSK